MWAREETVRSAGKGCDLHGLASWKSDAAHSNIGGRLSGRRGHVFEDARRAVVVGCALGDRGGALVPHQGLCRAARQGRTEP